MCRPYSRRHGRDSGVQNQAREFGDMRKNPGHVLVTCPSGFFILLRIVSPEFIVLQLTCYYIIRYRNIMKCPKCGGDRLTVEKFTGDGYDHRDYFCLDCKYSEDKVMGIATWKAIQDAKDAEQKKDEPDKGEQCGRMP